MKNENSLQYIQANIEVIRRHAWNDFFFFSKMVLGKDLMEEMPHKELCDFIMYGLEKSTQLGLDSDSFIKFSPMISTEYVKTQATGILKKLIMLPRGAFKSTVATICLPIWLLWHNRNLRVLIDSETFSNAKLYLAAIKSEIESNEMLKLICVDNSGKYLLDCDKKHTGSWKEEQIILKYRTKLGMKEPSIFCAGVDNARTGMHPDVIIYDDIVSERNVNTEDQIEKTKNHYKLSLSLLEPGGLLLVIGTRYHMGDLYGSLMESDSFDTLHRPAENKQGVLYFPTRLTKEFLASQRKDQGAYIFNSQYMLQPLNDSSSVFHPDIINKYDKAPNFTDVYIIFDPANSAKKKDDPSAIVVIGIDHKKDAFVIDYERMWKPPNEVIDRLFHYIDLYKHKLRKLGMETVGGYKLYMFIMKDEMKRRGVYVRIQELKTMQVAKNTRIESQLQPLFANGMLYIGYGHSELENELLEFPYGEHDDLIDCLAYLTQIIRPTGGFFQRYYTDTRYTPTNSITGY